MANACKILECFGRFLLLGWMFTMTCRHVRYRMLMQLLRLWILVHSTVLLALIARKIPCVAGVQGLCAQLVAFGIVGVNLYPRIQLVCVDVVLLSSSQRSALFLFALAPKRV